MRWYTCTPVAFGGGPDFFARDSGLLCHGFQMLGIESKAVMPLPVQESDEPDVLRVEESALRSSDWWRAQALDGVVLYAWGSPRFLPVARAIHEAEIFLVLNQDNGGMVSPSIHPQAWLREQLVLAGAGRVAGGWPNALWKIFKGLTAGLFYQDRLRAEHLAQGDVIACVSPEAASHHRTFCRRHDGDNLAGRVTVIPHAVDPRFHPLAGIRRERRVAAVGRWHDLAQKRPELLMAGAELLLERDPEVVIHIVGQETDRLRTWHAGLPQRERVVLEGRIEPAQLAALWSRVQVAWCPSAFESFHIASAEALCCGASVVAADSPSLSSMRWFTGEGDGRLAEPDDADGHVRALVAEFAAWSDGRRSADEISRRWVERLHAPAVVGKILAMKGARAEETRDA